MLRNAPVPLLFVAGNSAEIVLGVVLHYALYVYLVLFSKPEKMRSLGYHQPVGPCGETIPVPVSYTHLTLPTRIRV